MNSINKPMLVERLVTVDGCGARVLGASKVIGYAAVFFDAAGHPQDTYKGRTVAPMATSNMAEFEALRLAIREIVKRDDRNTQWVIYTDSKYTLSCWYNPEMVQKPWLIPIAKEWRELAAKVGWRINVRWLPGEDNLWADKASREAIVDESL